MENGIVPTMPVTAGYGNGFGNGSWIGEIAALGLVFGGGFGVNRGVDAGIQSQLNTIQSEISNSETNSQIDALQSELCSGIVSINNGIRDNGNLYLQGTGNLQTAIASGNFTTLQSINGLGNQITAQNNQNALQQLNSFNQLNTATLQGFNEVGRDNAIATNQIIAGQNAMAAQNAACCCKLEKAICDDGQETRALINAINLSNIEGQLADAKSQVNTLNQTIAQTAMLNSTASTIINHLKPVTPVVV